MTVHLAHAPETGSATCKGAKETQQRAIEVRDLVKRYPRASHNSVDNISFSVQPGEIFGLLGPNGAGKSTTIGVLTTNVRPTSGSVTIMDIDVIHDPVGARQRIAVVPQHYNLDQSLRAREILTFHARYHGVPRAEREARADTLLKELDLDGRGRDMPARFSGGMAQRLMIARALMHSPNVLFLDEPTNNLDPQVRLFLWERIRVLHEQGVTILLTTHDMEEADQLCERIAIMDHGRILVLDTPANLKKLLPGGTRLELQVCQARELEENDKVFNALRNLSSTLRVEKAPAITENEGHDQKLDIYHLYAEDADRYIVPAVQAISETGGELRNLQVTYPSLEDVFIYLTGRRLRS